MQFRPIASAAAIGLLVSYPNSPVALRSTGDWSDQSGCNNNPTSSPAAHRSAAFGGPSAYHRLRLEHLLHVSVHEQSIGMLRKQFFRSGNRGFNLSFGLAGSCQGPQTSPAMTARP
jgi:hypothetical protein